MASRNQNMIAGLEEDRRVDLVLIEGDAFGSRFRVILAPGFLTEGGICCFTSGSFEEVISELATVTSDS